MTGFGKQEVFHPRPVLHTPPSKPNPAVLLSSLLEQLLAVDISRLPHFPADRQVDVFAKIDDVKSVLAATSDAFALALPVIRLKTGIKTKNQEIKTRAMQAMTADELKEALAGVKKEELSEEDKAHYERILKDPPRLLIDNFEEPSPLGDLIVVAADERKLHVRHVAIARHSPRLNAMIRIEQGEKVLRLQKQYEGLYQAMLILHDIHFPTYDVTYSQPQLQWLQKFGEEYGVARIKGAIRIRGVYRDFEKPPYAKQHVVIKPGEATKKAPLRFQEYTLYFSYETLRCRSPVIDRHIREIQGVKYLCVPYHFTFGIVHLALKRLCDAKWCPSDFEHIPDSAMVSLRQFGKRFCFMDLVRSVDSFRRKFPTCEAFEFLLSKTPPIDNLDQKMAMAAKMLSDPLHSSVKQCLTEAGDCYFDPALGKFCQTKLFHSGLYVPWVFGKQYREEQEPLEEEEWLPANQEHRDEAREDRRPPARLPPLVEEVDEERDVSIASTVDCDARTVTTIIDDSCTVTTAAFDDDHSTLQWERDPRA